MLDFVYQSGNGIVLASSNIKVHSVSADSMYDTAVIHKELKERSITPYIRRTKIADKTKVEYKRNAFVYNHDSDVYICPSNKELLFRCLQRYESGIFKEYRANPKTCKDCPGRIKCLAPSQTSRKIQVNIFQDIVDGHHTADGSTPPITTPLKIAKSGVRVLLPCKNQGIT